MGWLMGRGVARSAGLAAVLCGGCGPSASVSGNDAGLDATDTDQATGLTTGVAESDTSGGGNCDRPQPADDELPMPRWCAFEESAVTPLGATAKLVLDAELGIPNSTMAWDGERVLFTFRGETADDPEEVRGSVGGDSTFDTVWLMPPGQHVNAIMPTTAGTLALLAGSADALFRLLPGGDLELVAEVEGIVVTHPLVVVGDWAYVLLRDAEGETRAGRISLVGAGAEEFPFQADTFALVDDGLIGLRAHTNNVCACHVEGCPTVVEWHELRRFDLATSRASTIADLLCVSGEDVPSPAPYRYGRVGIVSDGFVLDDGPLVHVGFDGTRRVLAAPSGASDGYADGDDTGQVVGDWIYLVSNLEDVGVDAHAVRRVPLRGGTTEELVQIPDAKYHSIVLGTVTATHVYIHDRDTTNPRANTIRRVAL